MDLVHQLSTLIFPATFSKHLVQSCVFHSVVGNTYYDLCDPRLCTREGYRAIGKDYNHYCLFWKERKSENSEEKKLNFFDRNTKVKKHKKSDNTTGGNAPLGNLLQTKKV